jgi:phytanoyl-CoA hydroxylase
VQRFHRDGYIVVRGLAGEALLREMRLATEEGLRREIPPIEYEADLQYPGAPRSLEERGGRTVRRLKQAHGRHPVFGQWLNFPPLLERVRQLLGPDVAVPLAHHNCIMTKQPRHSSETGWHQDIRYWSFARPELVSVWLALGDETRANGCLRLIPGSHRMHFDRGRFDDALFFRPDIPENAEVLRNEVTAELGAGDVLFFHCRTLHAATHNSTGEPKFSVVFTFRPLDNPPVAGSRSASLPELVFGGKRET